MDVAPDELKFNSQNCDDATYGKYVPVPSSSGLPDNFLDVALVDKNEIAYVYMNMPFHLHPAACAVKNLIPEQYNVSLSNWEPVD